MKRLLCLALLVLIPQISPAGAEDWSGWRGPRGDGTSLEQGVPTRWDGAAGKNIAWKVRVPGSGHSSPIVWQDRIFLASCLLESRERVLLCLDAHSGKTVWQETVFQGPLESKHRLNSFASCTPATDGEQVYVAFMEVDGDLIEAPNVGSPRLITPGRMIVAAYDYQGQQKWRVSPGKFVSAHGFCSNPVLYKDLVIVNGDHDGDAYIVALDRKTGDIRWKVERENKTRSYVTPIIREIDGRTQMILSGSLSVASYDPDNGRRHWIVDGPTEQFVASMVCDKDMVFLTAGYPEYHIVAIRANGKGNVTDSHIVWRTTRGAAYVPSPVIQGDHLLVVSDRGIASCFDLAGGERFWMERLGGHYSGSLVSAGGLVYFQNDDGQMTIVRPGRKLEVVARNELGEQCFSSPAISGGKLYIRGERHLFCVADDATD